MIAMKDRHVALLKGVAIIGVVAHHVANRRFAADDQLWIAYLGAFMDWSVPLFIILSGYLLGLKIKQGGTVDFWAGVRGRVRRLLLPFVVMSLVYAVIMDFVVRFGVLKDSSSSGIAWWQMWLAAISDRPGAVGEQLYFLPMLFLVSLIATVFLALTGGRGRHCFIGGLGLAVSGYVVHGCVGAGLRLYWPIDMLLMGGSVFLFSIWTALCSALHRQAFAFSVSFFVFVMLIFGSVYFLSFFVAMGLWLFVSRLKLTNRLFEYIGDASGSIFLYHTPFLLQPLLIISARYAPSSLHVYVAYFVMVFVVLLLSWMHHRILIGRLRFLRF